MFPGWLWICGFALVLVLVNTFNVELFGAVEYSFSALKITAILMFIVLGGCSCFPRTCIRRMQARQSASAIT